MATPRKNWSKQPDEILGMGWPDAAVADFTRLQAFLNTRWARYGLTPEQAGEAVLTPQEMMLVTNVQNPRSARRRLLALPSDTPQGAFHAHEVVTGKARCVKVRWSNFAEFQGYHDRRHPNAGPPAAERRPSDAPSEKRREEKRKEEEREKKVAVGPPLSALSDLVEIVKEKQPEWTEVQRASWLKANLPAIADGVAKEALRGDRHAAIRDKVRRFARAERKTPASTSAAGPGNGEEHPKRAMVKRRLAHLGHVDPTEGQIKAHWSQFGEELDLGPYIPPDCGEDNAGIAS